MLILNPITLEYEFMPRGLCFADNAGGDDGGGEGDQEGDTSGQEGDTGGGDTAGGDAASDPLAWRAQVTDPDALKEAERTTDLNSAFKRISELRKDLSSAVKVPGKNADEKEVTAFRKAMGIPESEDGYGDLFAEPEDGFTEEQKAENTEWSKAFLEAGLSKAGAEKLLTAYRERAQQAAEAVAAEDKRFADEQTEALKKDWGPDYEKNDNFAKAAFADFAQKAGVDVSELSEIEMKDGRLLMDVAGIKRIFASIGREMGEGSLGGTLTQGEVETIDKQVEDLRAERDRLQQEGKTRQANAKQQEIYGLLDKREQAA